MDEELSKIKSMLRSIVVSSSTQMDVRALVRDYRNLIGSPLPITKYGYRDPIVFLKERCSDCFLFQGSPSNPVLMLIVPDTLKHIDKFVQKQRVPSTAKFKGKRRSVMVPPQTSSNLISSTFQERMRKHPATIPPPTSHTPNKTNDNNHTTNTSHNTKHTTRLSSNNHTETKQADKNNDTSSNEDASRSRLRNFLKKKLSMYSSSQHVASEKSDDSSRSVDESSKGDVDSGYPTVSGTSSEKMTRFSKLRDEIVELLGHYPGGINCSDLITLYRNHFNRELNFLRFGFTSIISFACSLEDETLRLRAEDEECILSLGGRAPGLAAAGPPRPLKHLPVPAPAQRPVLDPDEALPGIDFDPDVYPEDCMHFLDSIAPAALADVQRGQLLEVLVGEVYSPSHFWLMRLGEDFNIALDKVMDDMNEYYNNGEGRNRVLAPGAVRPGQYCASVWEGDWHRSIVATVLDEDYVKVRHVDYGTVDRVAARALRPLLRGHAALPAQAVRARLAAVAPPAAARQWPRAAAAALLERVRNLKLVAEVFAKDEEEDILEVFLIDTSGAADECVGTALCRAGHAEPRAAPRTHLSEWCQFPRFSALESGRAPSYAELARYLRDGIALDCVPEYRAHVPCAPASPDSTDPEPDSLSSDSPEPRVPTPEPPRMPTPKIATTSIPKSVQTNPLPPNPTVSCPQLYPCSFPMQFFPQPVPMFGPPPPFVPIGPMRMQPRFDTRFNAPQRPFPPHNVQRPSFVPQNVQRPPIDPYAQTQPTGEVKLSVSECEVFRLLSQVDEHAAHCYMMDALRRAMPQVTPSAPTRLNPHAPEFRLPYGYYPPPGFHK